VEIMNAAIPETANRLGLIPDPAAIHRRLGELTRERQLLRRQLRLSMAAHQEQQQRASEKPEVAHAS
jgi:hypothetical protein